MQRRLVRLQDVHALREKDEGEHSEHDEPPVAKRATSDDSGIATSATNMNTRAR